MPKAKGPGGRPCHFEGKDPRSVSILLRPATKVLLKRMARNSEASRNDIMEAALLKLAELTGANPNLHALFPK